MKYYGIKNKRRHEDFMYWYARNSTKLKTFIPGEKGKLWKRDYDFIFNDNFRLSSFENQIPEGHYVGLNHFVTSDLILGEDISKLKNGLKWLLMNQRAGDRFLALPVNSVEEVFKNIDNMDSDLLAWHSWIDCGLFDFRGKKVQESIDHFSVNVRVANSSFLSLEFSVYLSEEKKKRLEDIINVDYHDDRGEARKYLSSGIKGKTITKYTVSRYSDYALKAKRINEIISFLQWDFYNALSDHFPFVIHGKNIQSPRIDVFFTDIDYHEDHKWFWSSVGVESWHGQFIDERHKMFFPNALFSTERSQNRLIYIVKDDDIEAGQLLSIKDEVYFHMKEYACEYFRHMFVSILTDNAEKAIVDQKHRMERIRLRRRGLKELLKIRYELDRRLDVFERFVREDNWKKSKRYLAEVYKNSDAIIERIKPDLIITWETFCEGIENTSKRISQRLIEVRKDFDGKEKVLQSLADYKNASKNWILSVIMLTVSIVTLFFVVFPDKAHSLAALLRMLWQSIIRLFPK